MTNADVMAWAGFLAGKYGIPWPIAHGEDEEDFEEEKDE